MTLQPDYANLVEGLGDMVYTLDLDGHFTYVNRAGVDLVGVELGRLLGCHFETVLSETSARVAREHFTRALSGHESTPFFEVQVRRADGSEVDVEIRAGGLFAGQSLVGRQGVARDITALKRLQAEVADKSARLALFEERARTALDLYRRIAELALNGPANPCGAERALQSVERSLARSAAEQRGLSAEDLQIIELLADGCSNQEIATHIHLSPHTVKDRVAKLMGVFAARSRAEVVGHAARAGLIGIESRGPDR